MISQKRPPQRITAAFAFSAVDRALHEGLARRQFGNAEMNQVLAFFGDNPPECVYCGNREVQRWDHLAAIRRGGETVLGNMVPACARCDDSKGDRPFEEWMLSDARFSPRSRQVQNTDQRIERVKAYIQHFGYAPRRLEQRLDNNELQRLTAIQSALAGIRTDIEDLIRDHARRIDTG